MRGERGGPARERLRVLGEPRPRDLPAPEVTGGWVPSAGPPVGPSVDPSVRLPGEPDDPFDDPFEGASDGPGDDRSEGSGDRQPWRLHLGGREVRPAAAIAAVVLAAAVAGFAWFRSEPGPPTVVDVPPRASVPARARQAGPVPAQDAAPAVTASPRGLVVDVEGRVRRPGLVRLPAGARVADAVVAAGGAAPGAALARLNLARSLTDGEQVVVPTPGDALAPASDPGGATGGPGAGPGTPAAPVDLNVATTAALDALPGVGPVLAGRIVAWRDAHGRFTSVDELGEVPGIGPKALERLRPLVRV